MDMKNLQKYIPHIVLIGIFVFMLWVRTLAFGEISQMGEAMFSGNDPYYHMRIVEFLVNNFPNVPSFDPWSYYPYGTGGHSGFGGLFDQLIAFVALIVGLGNPPTSLINKVGALAPAFFGALTVFPTYIITKKITDRWTALISAVVLALFTGQFLNRTIVGDTDHQSAEPLFGSLAVLGVLYYLDTAYREKPTIAHLRDRDWKGLKKPLLSSILGGIAISLYLMTWPPGVMIVFTFAVFIVLQTIRNHKKSSNEYLVFTSVVTFSVATIITLFYARSFTLSSTEFSLLQPLVCLGIAFGSVFLYLLSSYTKDYDFYYYPAGILGSVIGLLGIMWAVFPRGISMLQQLITRVYSFGILTSRSALTVAEIQPPTSINIGDFPLSGVFEFLLRTQAIDSFGLLYLVSLVSIFLLLYRQVVVPSSLSDKQSSKELLILLWSLSMVSAYFTMVRFEYYFAVNVAVLSGFLFYRVFNFIGLDLAKIDYEDITEIKGYQIITVLLLLFLIIPGNVLAIGIGGNTTWNIAPRVAGHNNPPWIQSMDWMQNNTPREPLNLYGSYTKPEDGNFDYPVDQSSLDGSYGVMSWWDYGHWITRLGNRIPYANPFQEGPIQASEYLTSKSEERAELVMEALPSIRDRTGEIENFSNEELQSIIEDQEHQERYEDGRYVVIDDRTAGGKFSAIATWTGPSPASYRGNDDFSLENQTLSLPALNNNYSSTMISRLYYDDANNMEHYRLVHETSSYSLIGTIANIQQQGLRIQRFNSVLSRVNYDDSIIGNVPIKRLGRSDQLIPIRQNNNYLYDFRSTASVKTFERVNGAKLVGQATPNTNVVALLNLQTVNTKRNFTYVQSINTTDNGSFSITVPYPTENQLGVEDGGTNEAIRYRGPYNIYTGNVSVGQINIGLQESPASVFGEPNKTASIEVPEQAIYEGTEIQVDLTPYNQTQ